MTCPAPESLPPGLRAWRGPVPKELVDFAIYVRNHIAKYPYGGVAENYVFQGENVGAFVSHHTWTYKGGRLVTGICIPGVSLVVAQSSPLGTGIVVKSSGDDLSNPDPDIAAWLASTTPPGFWAFCAAVGVELFALGWALRRRA